ncbi:glycosyltransferase family 2 protein [Paenibacillus qinlingensis]|uniref:Glycosyltransferase involved in cell wall biosynthesis n=1 Tax=Paenibacillus qinlingensis TaxID=1837343 RepID=A0ABU1NTC0_9BACL|nr:glycosyltransferase family 2 protein [Paenibacillus qinlingensis]MDR6550708.1 glycosyltransferase involved in cell wall biosynthesis [Paenibacillus qinlingensis]
MKGTIIIPSYNACERLYYNLLSLNLQDYPHDQFEVIVIDNGSADNTARMLSEFQASFRLEVVRIDENKGIAHGRNQGISKAAGDILIFHDSDMIAERSFVRKHIEAHINENTVVCGKTWKEIFTYYYKNFEDFRIPEFNKVKDQFDFPSDDLELDVRPLIPREKIIDGSFMNYSFRKDTPFIHSLEKVIQEFGSDLKGYHLPWRFFITNNSSVSRSKVVEVGRFDEKIVNWGFEDYDLGIRLYKAGCHFKLLDIINVHQAHPRNYARGEALKSFDYICHKYNDISHIDIVLACITTFLRGSLSMDEKELNDIVEDLYKLQKMDKYNRLLRYFLELLHIKKGTILNKVKNQVRNTSIVSMLDSELELQLNELVGKNGTSHFADALLDLQRSI